MTCGKYIKEAGFPLAVSVMGIIVGLRRNRLYWIYRNDRERFDKLLKETIFKWNSILPK